MPEPRNLVIATALVVLLGAVIVGVRLARCFRDSVRSRRYVIVAVSVTGVLAVAVLVAAVLVAWFSYAVARKEKTLGTDLQTFLVTIPPYFVALVLLWLLGGKLRSLLKPPASPPPGLAGPAGRTSGGNA